MLRGRRNRRRIDQAAVRAAARSALDQASRPLAAFGMLAAIALLTAWGSAAGRAYLHRSPAFAIDRITFEGTKRAAEEELLRLGGIALGENLFEADLVEVARGMAAHPWVRKVTLEREYPRGLTVRVVEHQPAALAELGGLYFVDDEGKAFKRLAAGEPADLPILTGFTREEYAERTEALEALFRDALAAAALYRESGLERKAPLSEIHVDEADGLTFFCGRNAVAVKLGTDAYAEKFTRLDALLAELSRRGTRAEVIRLDNRARPGWVVVQLARSVVELSQ